MDISLPPLPGVPNPSAVVTAIPYGPPTGLTTVAGPVAGSTTPPILAPASASPMACGVAVVVRVDPDELDGLVRRLGIVHEIMSRRLSYLPDPAALGSRRVWQAMHDFQHGWEEGRRRIAGNVQGLQARAQGVARTYREQDHELGTSYQEVR